VAARAALLVADLIEPARATALEKLDEHRRAVKIAKEWVRSRLEPSAADPDPTAET
jgi:hypothetical protein